MDINVYLPLCLLQTLTVVQGFPYAPSYKLLLLVLDLRKQLSPLLLIL